MIISASRRTDIPAYYSEWLFNRLKEGYALVRNPVNPRRISRVSLSPADVDGIVLWTKNPLPMLGRLAELEPYTYYFQFTLNPYGRDAEPSVPSKSSVIIPAFRRLSELIGPSRVIWRYDPIFFNDTYTPEYHVKYFRELASRLCGCTEKCTVSFIDFYKKTERSMRAFWITEPPQELMQSLMQRFSDIASEYVISINTCAEKEDYSEYGIGKARCIDAGLLGRISGRALSEKKDPNQRPECGCAQSIDIGAYNTCGHGCIYCYANHSRTSVMKNIKAHDPSSPLLFGKIGPDDIVTDRKPSSIKISK